MCAAFYCIDIVYIRMQTFSKMAVYQGVRQFEILTGRRAPFEEMLQVMKRALP